MVDTIKGLNYSLNGIYYNIIGNNDKSIKNYQKAAKLLENHPYRLIKVRINISYKDIGNFLQISHESVFKKKYRISKKINLDTDVDFQNYIIQF